MPDGNSPLSMGAPWSALSGLAGGEDPQATPMSPELQKGLQGLSDLSARFKVAGEAANVPSPPDEISMKTDPKTGQRTVNLKTSAENYENTTRSAMNWHSALGGMQQELQQMDAKLKAQQERAAAQPPWVQLATALSANLAQAKDMPGWVQAAGRTAAQLNPRPEQIAAQRMGVMGEEAKLAEAGARLEETQLQHQQMADYRKGQAQEARVKDLIQVENNASIEARKSGNFDKEAYFKERISLGDDPARALASADRLEGVAKDQKLAMADAQKTAEGKELAAETRRANHDIERDKEWWKRNAAQEAAKDAREVKKEALATAKDQKKQGQLGAVLEAKVEDILVAKRSTNRLLEIFDPTTQNPEYKHFQAIVGPLRGRETDVEKWLGTLNSTDAQLVAKINLQFANAVKTLGAGSYGYRISERGFLQSFTEALKNGAPQNYGNLKAWSVFYNDKIESFKDIKPEYDWGRVDGIMQMQPGQAEPPRKKAGAAPSSDPLGVR